MYASFIACMHSLLTCTVYMHNWPGLGLHTTQLYMYIHVYVYVYMYTYMYVSITEHVHGHGRHVVCILDWRCVQEARMSQEQLADQVARASEERQMMEKKLEAAEKV